MAQSTKKIDIIIIVVEINYTCSNLKNSIKKKNSGQTIDE